MYVAIVGSRDISAQTFALVRGFARSVASAGHSVVTGGARGTDHAAILGSLDAGEPPVVVLPLCIQHQPIEVRWVLPRCHVIEHPERAKAGYIHAIHTRNHEIVRGAHLTVVFHWGSPGSRSYIRYASEIGKPLRVFRVPFPGQKQNRKEVDRDVLHTRAER